MYGGAGMYPSQFLGQSEPDKDVYVPGDLAEAERLYEAAVGAAYRRYDRALSEAEHDLARAYERAFMETVERHVPGEAA